VDGNKFLSQKWCTLDAATSPFQLPMLLGGDLHMDKINSRFVANGEEYLEI